MAMTPAPHHHLGACRGAGATMSLAAHSGRRVKGLAEVLTASSFVMSLSGRDKHQERLSGASCERGRPVRSLVQEDLRKATDNAVSGGGGSGGGGDAAVKPVGEKEGYVQSCAHISG